MEPTPSPEPLHGPAELATGVAPALTDGRFGRLRRIAASVSGLMFAAVFVIFVYKIVTRYLEHDEAAWADEVSVILFIWIIFWANAFVVRNKEQITFDLLYHPMPETVRRGMAVARLLLVGGIFAYALPGSIDYLQFLWRERTPVLGLRLDLIYACFGLFMIAVVVRSAWGLFHLMGPRWRSHL